MKIKSIEDFLLLMDEKKVTSSQVLQFKPIFVEWILENLLQRREYVNYIKSEFNSIAKKNYPEYYKEYHFYVNFDEIPPDIYFNLDEGYTK